MAQGWQNFKQGFGDALDVGLSGAQAASPALGWAGPLVAIGSSLAQSGLHRFQNRSNNPQDGRMNNDYSQISNYSPEQRQTQNDILSQIYPQLANNNFGSFDPIEENYRRQFETNTLPGLQNQLTALGADSSHGGWGSSLKGAASNFELGLAALRSQHEGQQRGDMINLLQQGLTPQYQNVYDPSQQNSNVVNAISKYATPENLKSLLQGFRDLRGSKNKMPTSAPQQPFQTPMQSIGQQATNPSFLPQNIVGQYNQNQYGGSQGSMYKNPAFINNSILGNSAQYKPTF